MAEASNVSSEFDDKQYGPQHDSDYDGSFDFENNEDVKLSPILDEQAEGLENDPLGQDPNGSQTKESDELGQMIAKILRFHPFMRLFNVCATSMYLNKSKGVRMQLFSQTHPRFRKACMAGEFIFTTLLSIIILWALALTIMKLFGIAISWPISLSFPCIS